MSADDNIILRQILFHTIVQGNESRKSQIGREGRWIKENIEGRNIHTAKHLGSDFPSVAGEIEVSVVITL